MTIVKRGVKGTALTYDEMDENIRDLHQDTTIDRVLGNGNTTTKNITVGSLNVTTGQTINLGYTGSQGYVGWSIRQSSDSLIFSYSGTDKMKIDSSGNLIVVGNVRGYGTI
jgi:hypothetical protein